MSDESRNQRHSSKKCSRNVSFFGCSPCSSPKVARTVGGLGGESARAIGVTQESAWFMLHRIRLGLSLNAKKFGTKAKIGGGS
jgi:hypothetical protein